MSERTFTDFMREVHETLSGKANDKGYASGPDGPNPLFELTGSNHAVGEIIYKAVRFRSKGNPEELLKIAAWAFLIWRHMEVKDE